MTIVLAFASNALLNLLLGLILAGVLGPAEYGRYAVGAMLAIVLATALFDWLRLSTTRFTRGATASLNASLGAGYLAIAVLLAGLVVAAQATGLLVPVLGIPLAVVILLAIAGAFFEFRTAEARAHFLDGDYLKLLLWKNALAFAAMISVALLLRSAIWVLVALALGTAAVSLLAARGSFASRTAPVTSARGDHFLTFARYGFPIVAANLIYQVVVLVNRWVGAGDFGLAEAGRLSLATDLTIRLFLSASAALDAYIFQLAVERQAREGAEAARRQLADNMVVIGATLAFLATAYLAAMPALQALFVPAAYHGTFAELSSILVPGVVAFCFVQFGLSPVFQLGGRTGPVLWTATVALAVDLVLLWAIPRSMGVSGLALAHSGALCAGFLCATAIALGQGALWPSLRNIAGVLLATGGAAAAMWPLRALETPWLALVGAGLAGTAAFVGLLLALNVMGLRTDILRRFSARRAAPALDPGQAKAN